MRTESQVRKKGENKLQTQNKTWKHARDPRGKVPPRQISRIDSTKANTGAKWVVHQSFHQFLSPLRCRCPMFLWVKIHPWLSLFVQAKKLLNFLPKQVPSVPINCYPKRQNVQCHRNICQVSHEAKSRQFPSRSFAGMQEPMQKPEQCDNGVLSFTGCPNSN